MTRIRLVLASTAAVAVALPAAALAQLPPHTSMYDQNPASSGLFDDVSVTYNRATHKASLSVTNECLGVSYLQGKAYPDTATASSLKAVAGKVSFHGKMSVYSMWSKAGRVSVKLAVTIKPKKATGKVRFLAGTCHTITFTARLLASRK